MLKSIIIILCLMIFIQLSYESSIGDRTLHFKNKKIKKEKTNSLAHADEDEKESIVFERVLQHNSDKRFTLASSLVITDTDSTTSRSTTCAECPRQAVCVPHVQCPAHVRESNVIECHLTTNKNGICCTTGKNHTANHVRTQARQTAKPIDLENIHRAIHFSEKEYQEWKAKENNILRESPEAIVQEGTASFGHYRTYRVFNQAELDTIVSLANKALEVTLATKALKEREIIPSENIELNLLEIDINSTPLRDACFPSAPCNTFTDRYRAIDGYCNNIFNSNWGMVSMPYSRLLPPSYEDGIWAPRMSTNAEPLPSARAISSHLFPEYDQPDEKHSLLLMQFGQFLSHDITKAFHSTFQNGSGISCCTPDGTSEINPEFRHIACMPIVIDSRDPFYKNFDHRCMNFVRSFISPRSDCTLGYSQQMNIVTHFIDGSMIYGSDSATMNDLRTFEGGLLKCFHDFRRDLLPLSRQPASDCVLMERGSACFFAGDSRSNQFILLSALHLLFVREHNRIATQLAILNPYWNDETIFQEARRILIAELQHIVYNEWLPLVLGEETMEDFNLNINKDGYSFDYNPQIDPSIINEFATAAIRLHTLVDAKIKIYEGDEMEEVIEISDVMERPEKMRRRKFFDSALNTLTTQPMQKFDAFFAEGVTRYMFRAGNPYGLDVASLNIQRGRDHGLRPYNDYRQLVGLPRIVKWEQYPPEIAAILSNLYSSPDDMDLYVGAILEPIEQNSIVGKTFRDIIAEQFSRTRQGDRYFYEHNPSINPGYFTPDQLREIKKVTMARIICDNNDHILLLKQPLNAFMVPSEKNEYVDCSDSKIPQMNLQYWKN